jgi:hypothetical protein
MDFWVEQIEARWRDEDRAAWLDLPDVTAETETTTSGSELEDEDVMEAEPDSALVAAAREALESIMGAAILDQLPPAEMVEIARSYGLINEPEANHE